MNERVARVAGTELRTLMYLYSLEGTEGVEIIAKLLNTKINVVQGWFSRGIPWVNFELLKYKLEARRNETTAVFARVS